MLHPFVAQLVLAASVELESRMSSQVKAKAVAVAAPLLRFAWQDAEDWAGNTVDRHVCSYVMCGVEQFGDLHDLGCATDKGWAKGMPWQVTVMSTSDGFACHAIPQVLVGIRGLWHPPI